MKILISGICGFVGCTIATAWMESKDNHMFYGLDNFIRPGSETNRLKLKRMGANLFHADIRLQSDFETLPDVDWVIDAAANPSVLAGIDDKMSSRQLIEHNLIGALNLLEYCKLRKAGFLLLSTSRVYSILPLSALKVESFCNAYRPIFSDIDIPGLTDKGVNESFPTDPPISIYGASKLASEVLVQEYGAAFDFPVWINRCGVLSGAGQFGRPDQGIFSFWINSWLHRKPMSYIGFNGMGFQVRDCLHPKDLIPLLEKQISSSGKDKLPIQNVSGGVDCTMSLAQLSEWCHDRFGPHVIEKKPVKRPFDIPWLVLDSSRAFLQWDWKPQTPILQILEEIALHAEANPNWLEISSNL